MAEKRAVLGFLRDCYAADNQRLGLYDLFSRKARLRHVLPGPEEVSAGLLHRLPVDLDWAEEAHKAALLYRRERRLIYGAV